MLILRLKHIYNAVTVHNPTQGLLVQRKYLCCEIRLTKYLCDDMLHKLRFLVRLRAFMVASLVSSQSCCNALVSEAQGSLVGRMLESGGFDC